MADARRAFAAHPVAALLATGLGAGLSPVAPGTAGSLLGLALAWLLSSHGGILGLPLGLLMSGLVLGALGVAVSGPVSRALGAEDPGCIVIDEVAGQVIACTAVGLVPGDGDASSRLWPWIAAGDAGNVSVVWYQTEPQDGFPDLDCQAGHIHVLEASILGATGKKPTKLSVDAAGRAVHVGWVCQGGTTCVATGQDRRLGDYFTNALDARGCVLIATGDTLLVDPTTGAPLPTARPVFLRQTAGPRLIGSGSCN